MTTLHEKLKFSIKDFFGKCDQIRSFLRIWSHLLRKPLMKNFIFCAVQDFDICFHSFIERYFGTNLMLNSVQSRPKLIIHQSFMWRSATSYHKRVSVLSVITAPGDYLSNIAQKMKFSVKYFFIFCPV